MTHVQADRTRVVILASDMRQGRLNARAVEAIAGDRVEVVVTGVRASAIASARREDTSRVVVVADLHLGVANAGLEALRHIASLRPDARLVLISPHSRLDAEGAGVHRVAPPEQASWAILHEASALSPAARDAGAAADETLAEAAPLAAA